jgi:hypothetical protein
VEWVAEDCFFVCSFRQLDRQQLTPAKGIAKDCGAVRSADATSHNQLLTITLCHNCGVGCRGLFLVCLFRQLDRQQLTPAKGIAKDSGAVLQTQQTTINS